MLLVTSSEQDGRMPATKLLTKTLYFLKAKNCHFGERRKLTVILDRNYADYLGGEPGCCSSTGEDAECGGLGGGKGGCFCSSEALCSATAGWKVR